MFGNQKREYTLEEMVCKLVERKLLERRTDAFHNGEDPIPPLPDYGDIQEYIKNMNPYTLLTFISAALERD